MNIATGTNSNMRPSPRQIPLGFVRARLSQTLTFERPQILTKELLDKAMASLSQEIGLLGNFAMNTASETVFVGSSNEGIMPIYRFARNFISPPPDLSSFSCGYFQMQTAEAGMFDINAFLTMGASLHENSMSFNRSFSSLLSNNGFRVASKILTPNCVNITAACMLDPDVVDLNTPFALTKDKMPGFFRFVLSSPDPTISFALHVHTGNLAVGDSELGHAHIGKAVFPGLSIDPEKKTDVLAGALFFKKPAIGIFEAMVVIGSDFYDTPPMDRIDALKLLLKDLFRSGGHGEVLLEDRPVRNGRVSFSMKIK